ncbi:hypothetical protein F935_01000 [Acinetobacter calcoaceticus ANC 3811]|uniref:Uncharacterized protein n=1 Tax=Acinetobacter calcoaceticus ANC 3811 TaxID=1217690 RepID=R8Y4C7_ACICA|nr:hypothetical protein [Acinetobacter calcoaceticus]EOQ64233.1 hypothetical protein F935_01000 [Acinetobacter calcoaceticus ANC 3811]
MIIARAIVNEHEILAEFQRKSLLSYQEYTHSRNIQYGKHPRSTLDLFPLNYALNLSSEDILKYSPIHQLNRVTIPCSIFCGELELEELKWQSQNYFEIKKEQDQDFISFSLIPKNNQYSILEYYFKSILF